MAANDRPNQERETSLCDQSGLAAAAAGGYTAGVKTESPMTAAEREETRRRLDIWRDAEPLLEEQRWRELMALTDEKALWLTKALLSRRLDYSPKRDTSGLVEQQALFRKLASP
jgi:hypothetical protein